MCSWSWSSLQTDREEGRRERKEKGGEERERSCLAVMRSEVLMSKICYSNKVARVLCEVLNEKSYTEGVILACKSFSSCGVFCQAN